MDGLGEALRTTGEGWREGAGFGGRCWIGWMVIGGEDGSDSFSDDRGSDDSSGWRLRGWAASAARGGGWGRGRAWGRWVWMRSGEVQSESRSRRRWGGSREREGSQGGETQEEGSGACREKEGGDETPGEFRLRGAAGGGGRVSSGRRGVARTQERRRPDSDGDSRTGRGPAGRRRRTASATRTATTTATARTDSDDGDSRGRGLSAETWAAIRPSGSKVRLGTKFAIEDSSSDRDDGSNFSDEGDSDSISDDPEQRRQRGPGQQRQRRRQRGRWRVVRGDVASDVREGPHRRQQRRMAALSSARRRFDVDETRTVPGTVREEGAWIGGATAVGDTSRASKCLGALELQREGGVGGQSGRHSPVAVGGLFRRRVWERAHHRFVGIGVTRLISNKS